MKHRTSSACSPKPEPAPAAPSLRAPTAAALVSRWSAHHTHAAGTSFAASLLFEDLSLGRRSPSPTPPPCPLWPSRASQPPASLVAESLDLYFPTWSALETGQHKNSLCLEVARYLRAAKKERRKNKKEVLHKNFSATSGRNINHS